MIAQENRPLAGVGYVGRLLHDLDDRMRVLLGDGHVHPRHQREVVGHLAFVGVAEILAHVLGPLIGFCEQQAVIVVRVE